MNPLCRWLLSATCVLSLFLSFHAHAAPIDIKFSLASAENIPYTVAARDFCDYIAKETNGKYHVSLYPNYKLGNASTIMQGIQRGTIQLAMDGTGNLTAFAPVLGVFDLPYVLPDAKSMDHILNGPVGKEICDELTNKSITYLFFMDCPPRVMMMNRPLANLDEAGKMRVRTTLSKTHINNMKALGFNATPMPMTEVFTAIQQKVVDGNDQPYIYGKTFAMQEVCPYVFESFHMATPQIMVTGTKWWNSLDPQDREIFMNGLLQYKKQVNAMIADAEATARQEFIDAGVTIVTPDAAERQRWIDKSKSAYNGMDAAQRKLYERIHDELLKAGLVAK